jgi:hypothetical protein
MAEWLEDHVTAICSLNSTLWFSDWNLIKLETGRGPYGKVETAGWKSQEVICGKPTSPRL